MKSTVEQLTPKDRKTLSTFYETDTYAALKRLCELERDELARDAIEQRDIAEVRYMHGQAMSLKKLFQTIKDLNKKS